MNDLLLRGYQIDAVGAVERMRSASGRVCAKEGCETRLSIYNSDPTCYPHTPKDYKNPGLCAGLPRGSRRSEGTIMDFSEVKTTKRGLAKPSPQHGTPWGYNRGCRCQPCRDAAAAERRRERERKARREAV